MKYQKSLILCSRISTEGVFNMVKQIMDKLTRIVYNIISEDKDCFIINKCAGIGNIPISKNKFEVVY